MRYLWHFFILLFLLTYSINAAVTTPRAAIVFDASGSMWGKINGITKIDIAKEALRDVIEDWNTEIPLGLTIYGHRKKADCNDIETVIPVGKVEKDKILSIIQNIKPKGKTPIIRSLQKVAKELKYTQYKTTIILISDGKETCDDEPLKAIKKLKREGLDLTIHVIGFNVDKETSDQLQTIAKMAGGTYLPAKDAATLNKAVKVIAKKVQKLKPTPLPQKNLEITASEKKGDQWIQALHTLYLKDTNVSSQIIASCVSYNHVPCKLKIPAGKYMIHSSYNLYQKRTTIQVSEEEIKKIHIVMGETGTTAITARESKGEKKISLHYSIFSNDKKTMIVSGNTHIEEVVTEKLPVGKYIIQAEYYGYYHSFSFMIKAGKTMKTEIIAGETGKINISASEKKGEKWIDAFHIFYKHNNVNKDESNITASCYSGTEKPCQVQLPVDHYGIRSQYKDLTITTYLDIQYQKEIIKHIIMKPTGKVEIIAREEEKGKFIVVDYTIIPFKDKKTDDNYTVLSGKTLSTKPETVELFKGKYWIEAEYCTYKKRFSFEIKADSIQQIELVMGKTGNAIISTVLKKNDKPIWAKYTLYRDQNDTLEMLDTQCKRIGDSNCTLHLPVGNYLIKAYYDPFIRTKKLHITAEETSNIKFVMNPSGKVQISAHEENSDKSIETFHKINRFIHNDVNESNITKLCKSEEKRPCILELPVGHYLLTSTYNQFRTKTPFKIKEDEVSQLHIIMGQTGEVNITIYAKENGEPLQATSYILQKDGNQSKNITSCSYSRHCIKRLPIGDYFVRSEYNILKNKTAFEVKVGETKHLPIIIGEIGIVEIYTIRSSKKEKVKADHMIYKVENDNSLVYISLMCWYDKKLQGCSVKLPTGKYLLKSTYQDITKETEFEVRGDKINKVYIMINTEKF